MKKTHMFCFLFALWCNHPFASPIMNRFYKEFGNTTTLQHSTIITALIGNRPIRPKITSILSLLMDSFFEMENNLMSLTSYIGKTLSKERITSKPALQNWFAENFQSESSFTCLHKQIQTDFDSFFASMLQGSIEELTTEINRVYNNEDGLVKNITQYHSFFKTRPQENELYRIVNELEDDQTKHVILFLLKAIRKSIKKTLFHFELSKQDLEEAKNHPEDTYFEDITSRIEYLERQLDAIMRFLSARHRPTNMGSEEDLSGLPLS
jgi:hypothetical protein